MGDDVHFNGDKWNTGMRLWLKQNWLLLIMLVAGAMWVADVQSFMRTGDRYTGKQGALVEYRVGELETDIKDMKDDLKWIRNHMEHPPNP